MRGFIVFALLQITASPAVAADWRLALVGEESDLGRTLAFVDVESLERVGSNLKFRVDMRIERPPVTADGTRGHISADCAERWFEVGEASYYRGSEWLKPAPSEARQPAGPGTNMGALLDNVCAGRFLSETVDPVAYAHSYLGKK